MPNNCLKYMNPAQLKAYKREKSRESYLRKHPEAKKYRDLKDLPEKERLEAIQQQRKAYYLANAPKTLAAAFLRTKARLEALAGRPRPRKCEVCGSPNQNKNAALHFDHDHSTGKFRGWLCSHCNTILGKVHDNPALLRKLAKYLEDHADVH